MIVGEAARSSQWLLIESQHRIALSHVAMDRARFLVTRRRSIGGASDSGATEPRRCRHSDPLRFPGHGTYREICAERDEFAAEFPDRLVSPVMRSKTGTWEWTFCAECPAASKSQPAT
jgi:hypothetical protein